MAANSAYVVMVPAEGDGLYPEWKNFTVVAGATDQIYRVMIQWEGELYDFSGIYIIPQGWTGPLIPPLPGTNQSTITFESTDEVFDIILGQNGTFKLKYDSGPSEGDYDFLVTTVDRNTLLTQDFHLQQHVIPEFSALIVFPLFIIPTLLAVGLRKRKQVGSH
jgi:hypothetical protein